MKKFGIGQLLSYIILGIVVLLMVFPLFMAVWGSFKTQATFNDTKWFPTLPLNLNNIFYAFGALKEYILNTVFVGVTGTFGMLVVSTLASYAFARMKFFGKNLLFAMVIGLMMIPAIMTLVPSFMLYKKLVGTDTYIILILPIITGGSVFGVFLLRGFFESIDESIFEAARIDGASDLTCFFKICLPLCLPILATLAIMQLTGVWNDYIWPMIACPTDISKLTIGAAMKRSFVSGNTSNYPMLFSGYLVSSIPLILLFIFCNKFYVEGLTSSAVKF